MVQTRLLNIPPAARRRALAVGAALLVTGGGGVAVAYAISGLAHLRHRQPHTTHPPGRLLGAPRQHAEGLSDGEERRTEGGGENERALASRRKGDGSGDSGGGDGGRDERSGGRRGRRGKGKGGGMAALGAVLRLIVTRMGDKGAQRLVLLAVLAVLRTVLSNRLARVQGFLFRAAFLRRVPLFLRLLSENLVLCVATSALISSSKYLTASLALQARGILTGVIHRAYFQGMAYYRMSHVDKRVDSVEQRIVSDVPSLCNDAADLVQDVLLALCDAAFYTASLCSYTSPKYGLGILAYVLGAGVVTTVLAPPFGKLLGKEQEHEGEYRQLQSRVRTHCESIAFYRGHKLESSRLASSFRSLVRHSAGVLHTQWWFGMVQDFFLKYCGATWAVVLIIGPFFGSSVLSSSHAPEEARAQLLSAMRYHTSVVISLFQAMGTLAGSSRRIMRLGGYSARIWELLSVAKELSSDDANTVGGSSDSAAAAAAAGTSGGQMVPAMGLELGEFREAKYIEFEDVTVMTPAGTKLVEGLTLRVDPGHNLLITGPNGSGKSSLFRVLGGLWPLCKGRIAKPGRAADLSHDIFYVPQRPYMAIGTLQEQLIYPLTAADLPHPLPEERIRDMLRIVDLEELLDRYGLEEEVNWGERLSLGQQQRLGMARLFYHAPAFAILDECTSAVTTDMEERFCERVRAMGTTCVTISHRPALVAFHDTVLALDGEGGWSVHYKTDLQSGEELGGKALAASPRAALSSRKTSLHEQQQQHGKDMDKGGGMQLSERKTDASVNTQHFLNAAAAASAASPGPTGHEGGRAAQQALECEDGGRSLGTVVARSPTLTLSMRSAIPQVPRLQPRQRSLGARIIAIWRILLPKLASWQGFQLASLGFLVVARTGLSDRIANLNGTSVRNVLQQDRKAFNRLILVSLVQSLASAIIAPTLRHIASSLALAWRTRLTNHLTRLYFRNNAYYKVAALGDDMVTDPDQRMCEDVNKLCSDVAGLVSSLVKPTVDILWFTWRMRCLTGRRGVAILYAYMLLGLGFLRAIAPDFAALTTENQHLEGAFRFMHNRLRTHAESVAFFGGGNREHEVIAQRFMRVLGQRRLMLHKRWLFGIADEFITKQLPHNVTWGLSLLYALDHPVDTSSASQGELAHQLRFLASVVSHSFLAFGDILELYRKVQELTGIVARVMQLDEALLAAIATDTDSTSYLQAGKGDAADGETDYDAAMAVGFRDADIVTPGQKLLAYKLSLSVKPGRSLLVTGPNGSGKSSLFRVLGGLWPLVSGSIFKPGPAAVPTSPLVDASFSPSPSSPSGIRRRRPFGTASPREIKGIREGSSSSSSSSSMSSANLQGLMGSMFYVPQRPYAALGTLRDQIIYPLSLDEVLPRVLLPDEGSTRFGDGGGRGGGGEGALLQRRRVAALDAELQQIMEAVRLQYLVQREGGWDATAVWEDVLSLGEQQRLGMARLFFHQPVFGILDECTNATSVDVEEALYQKAKELGITVVTISQRPALIPYHSQELRLIDGEGQWELRNINAAGSSGSRLVEKLTASVEEDHV